MTVPSLLPPNATELARGLEAALALDARLPDIEAITGPKLDADDPFVPWLVWEYGLGELLPYLTDQRAAIRQGVAWQRVRGTARALRLALGWVGFDAAAIEESGPGHAWWRLQLDPGRVPERDEVPRAVAVAGLALPARSRLVRFFHGYDFRAGVYDAPVGKRQLWDDWSGVDADGVRQSFGQSVGHAVERPAAVARCGTVADAGVSCRRDRADRYEGATYDGPVAPITLRAAADRSDARELAAADTPWGAGPWTDAPWGVATAGAVTAAAAALALARPAPVPHAAGTTATAARVTRPAVTAGAGGAMAIVMRLPADDSGWGAGPWTDQPWGRATAGFRMETSA